MQFTESEANLEIAIEDSSDKVTILNQLDSNRLLNDPDTNMDGIETIQAQDGIVIVGNNAANILEGDSVNFNNNPQLNDYIYAAAGNDELHGKTGNDYLNGGSGNDTYVFNLGDGHDTVEDPSGIDTIYFGAGIEQADVILKDNGDGSHTVYIAGNTSDSLTIKYGAEGLASVEHFNFDGVEWDYDNVIDGKLADTTYGNDHVPNIKGTIENDLIFTYQKYFDVPADYVWPDNIVIPDEGDDLVYGGVGKDLIVGGVMPKDIYEHDDTHAQQNIFDGNDTFYGGSGNDVLFSYTGNDLFYGDDGNDILAGGASLNGGEGSDELRASSSVNTFLEGGIGNDLMSGRNGNDMYFYNIGDGNDVIFELNDFIEDPTYHGSIDPSTENIDWQSIVETDPGFLSYASELGYIGGDDTIKFGAGVDLNNILFNKNGADLLISFSNAAGSILVKSQFSNTLQRIERFEFSDSSFISFQDILGQFEDDSPSISGGIGDDVIVGGGTYQSINGGDGNDYIIGNSLGDTLSGEDGNDTIDAGSGADTVVGGLGDDTYIINTSDVTVIENLAEGNDTVISYVDYSLGTNLEKLILTGQSDIDGTGNSLDNTLTGNSGANVLSGGAGQDSLQGGQGNDTYVFGLGTGQDTILESGGIDTIQFGTGISVEDITFIQVGSDLIITNTITSDSITITAQFYDEFPEYRVENFVFENNTIYDAEDIKNIVEQHVNTLGNDTFVGDDGNEQYNYLINAGNDVILEGGSESVPLEAGQDSLIFSNGIDASDVIFNNNGADLIISVNGQSGQLTVKNQLNPILLGNRIEAFNFDNDPDLTANDVLNLLPSQTASSITGSSGNDFILGAAASQSIDGSFGNDIILGQGGDDSIEGWDGNDTLYGGTGSDTLSGGANNDSYLIDTVNDLIVENSNSGTDTVYSQITYTLDSNVENLSLLDSSDLDGTGNTLNNVLYGNIGANELSGLTGNDTLMGNAGNDTYHISLGNGQDVIQEGSFSIDYGYINGNQSGGNDTLKFGSGILLSDLTFALDGVDLVITIGNGNDQVTLKGYFADLADESAIGQKIEAIELSDTTLITRAHILENLKLKGTSSADYLEYSNQALPIGQTILGLGGDDTLVSGDTNDTLDGGDGADELWGGQGNDVYIVDNALDTINESEQSNEGQDKVISSISHELGLFVEDLTLTGSDNLIATGNAQNNTITGNSGNNVIDGEEGQDTLVGAIGDDTYIIDNAADVVVENLNEGNDIAYSSASWQLAANVENLTLTGNAHSAIGNDLNNYIVGNNSSNLLEGKAGVDTLAGAQGDDQYVIDNVSDVVLENSNEGVDTVSSTVTYTLSSNIEHLVLTGTGETSGTGNSLDNYLTGNSANNTLSGGVGSDTLNGGQGADSLIGGAGDDYYYVDNVNDTVTELENEGIDLVNSTVAYSLSNNVENLQLAGNGNITGSGNSLNNIILGNAANNTLQGLSGDDTIDGAAGIDTLIGGDGNDAYIVDNVADTITENADAGTDIVSSSVSFTLSSNIENLILTGGASINGTGNQLDNLLAGNSSSNTLYGLGGNDTLAGSGGADSLIGGEGNDTYIIDSLSDTVIEAVGEGIDTVITAIDYTLSSNFENITLEGFADITATGNTAANILNGNLGDNEISGGEGADQLFGDYGDDTLEAGLGNDTLNGGLGNDLLKGDDTLSVGTENDTYIFSGTFGNDTISDSFGNADTVSLNGYNSEVLGITWSAIDGNDLDSNIDTLLLDLGNNTSITIQNYFDNTTTDLQQLSVGTGEIESLVFDNDTLNYADVVSILGGSAPSSETINGTAGNDVLNGTSLDSTIYGLAGNDTINGNDGNDSLSGGDDADTLDGGQGLDTLIGGSGNDTYIVDTTIDTITENSNEGIDTLQSSVSNTLNGNVENLVLTGANAVNGTGNTLGNEITGNSADNILDGQAGADTLIGGSGNDTYIIDNAGDVATESASSGTDTVQAGISYTLGSNIENLTLTGSAAINGTGNSLNNTILGNAGNNVLNGDAGVDTLSGGDGNDTYVVDSLTDLIIENSGEGTDTVQSSVAYTLGNHIETLVLTGASAIMGTGNTLNNEITGNSGNNTLDGAVGTDTLIGGTGNDTYIVDDVNDVVTENSAAGTDTVQSSVTYTLSDHVENLVLTGSAAINGTGNALNNQLTGNGANNELNGGTGVDTLIGGLGDDLYIVDGVTDVITEAASEGTDTVQSSATYTMGTNVENLILTGASALNGTGNTLDNNIVGNAGNNSLTGSSGHDTLDGASGVDTLVGGIGNDVYVVDNASDVVTEAASEGTDTVQSGVTYTLAGNIENLTLTGSSALNGTGNTLNNVITGNSGNNSLSGGTGNDTLVGSLGDDTYVVDSTTDVITENASEGTDTAQAGVTYTLNANVENLLLTGTGAIAGTGNSLDNQITGNTGNNTLNGSTGIDTLIGGTGNDTYIIDDIGDVITENAAAGTDTVQTSLSYTLDTNVENLVLTGSSAINGIGNALNNQITGNSGNNELNGDAGIDTLAGGLGNDLYIVDSATDIITEGASAGTDTVQSSVTLTLGTNVENLILTGASALNGTGNTLNNVITGNSGNNSLSGAAGADTLVGGLGDDIYVVDNAGDVITEANAEGTDLVQAGVTYTLAANVENITIMGTSGIHGTGNALDNLLTGNSGNNSLSGAGGNDTLNGTTGTDTLIGGSGDDYYIIDAATDVITENLAEGLDTVQIGATYTLGNNVENLILTGATALNGTGNSLNNALTGNTGNNSLVGSGGHDTLNGGTGADTMTGGTNDDVYIVDNAGDVVTEAAAEGTDTVQSGLTYTLGNNVENLTLTGTNAINGTGNTVNNVIIGNSGNNSLSGATGTDTLIGGAGNDTYIVDNGNDVITEALAEGTDIVQSSVTYTLSSNIENLTLTGMSAINGTGNTLNNQIVGNSNFNVLDGGAGIDTLTGGAGNDSYFVDDAADSILENLGEGTDEVQASTSYTLGANLETLYLIGSALNGTGNTLANTLVGNGLANSIDGASGNDSIWGNGGNDTILGGVGLDSISAGDGEDSINGQDNDDILFGENGHDIVIGEQGNDWVIGQEGNDTLNGGVGTDSMDGGNGNDTYVFVQNWGTDIIASDSSGNDTVDFSALTTVLVSDLDTTTYEAFSGSNTVDWAGTIIENLIAGSGNDYLTGNNVANIITGNSGNDSIWGEAGSDTLYGGAGADELVGGNDADRIEAGDDNDLVWGDAGNDTLYGGLGSDSIQGGTNNDSLFGENGNDILFGEANNDTMTGGIGNDTMVGDIGNDVYLFSKGDGQDIIWDYDTTVGNSDKVVLDSSVSQSVVAVFINSSGYLEIGYTDSAGDKITVEDYSVAANKIERFELSNGNYLTNTEMNQIIQSMATYATNNSISFTSLDDVKNNANLMAIVNGGWHT